MIGKIRKMLKEKAGVSPIIAIILMVAITVVLAATIYVWVSGFGTSSTKSENAAVTVKGESGPQIRVILTKGGDNAPYSVNNTDFSIYVDGIKYTPSSIGGDYYWDAGESIIIDSSWSDWDTNWQGTYVPVTVEILGTAVFDSTVYVPSS